MQARGSEVRAQPLLGQGHYGQSPHAQDTGTLDCFTPEETVAGAPGGVSDVWKVDELGLGLSPAGFQDWMYVKATVWTKALSLYFLRNFQKLLAAGAQNEKTRHRDKEFSYFF